MKTLIQFCAFGLLLAPGFLFGQTFGAVDANRIAARFHAEGDMFWDLVGDPTFEVPKGSGTHAIFAGSPWIGALDESGQLRVAAQTYRQAGVDYAAGPIATTYPASYDQRYQRVWTVTTQEIDIHKLNYGQIGYVAPSGIRDWPGNGDVTNGEPAQLAPYIDLNGNERYEPALGEYPAIKGDQALFAIFNDSRVFHTETGGEALNMEFHLMAYAYNRATDGPEDWLNDVLFLDYTLFNKGKSALSDTYLGMWLDWDIGEFRDDYIGCDSTRDMWFGYNADNLDSYFSYGYGVSPPAMGATWLNQPLQHHMYWSNDFTATGNPTLPEHYYNYLASQWKDGLPLTEGGTGYGGTVPTNFAFPGNPVDASPTEWHEANEGNTAGDRKALGSIGPFTMLPLESKCAQLALVYGRDVEGNNLSSVSILKTKVDSVRAYFANPTGEGCLLSGAQSVMTPTFIATQEHMSWKVAPNPAKTSISLIFPQTIRSEADVELFDAQGRTLGRRHITPTSSTSWPIEALPNGAYWFRITSDQAVQTISWLKQTE